MNKGYTAYVLTEEAKTALLLAYPPRYPDVIAHHVTHQYGVDGSKMPPNAEIKIMAEVWDDDLGVQAVAVKVNDNMKRPDGKQYHITISLDKSKGAKPVMSNKLFPASKDIKMANPGQMVDAHPTYIKL